MTQQLATQQLTMCLPQCASHNATPQLERAAAPLHARRFASGMFGRWVRGADVSTSTSSRCFLTSPAPPPQEQEPATEHEQARAPASPAHEPAPAHAEAPATRAHELAPPRSPPRSPPSPKQPPPPPPRSPPPSSGKKTPGKGRPSKRSRNLRPRILDAPQPHVPVALMDVPSKMPVRGIHQPPSSRPAVLCTFANRTPCCTSASCCPGTQLGHEEVNSAPCVLACHLQSTPCHAHAQCIETLAPLLLRNKGTDNDTDDREANTGAHCAHSGADRGAHHEAADTRAHNGAHKGAHRGIIQEWNLESYTSVAEKLLPS